MNLRRAAASLVAAFAMGGATHASAIESQAQDLAKSLPAEVRQVLACGAWSRGSASGHYRVVLLDVSLGAGTEVYIQRIEERTTESGQSVRLVETLPVRELNDDHAQYQVVSARCTPSTTRSVVDLLATFEHDAQDVLRRIRISLPTNGHYEITGVVGQRGGRK